MRKDVVRGVRWAMVLSAVAFGSIAVDRVVRSTSADAAAPVSVQPIQPIQEEVAPPELLDVAAPTPVEPEPVAPVRILPKPKVQLVPVPQPPSLPPLNETAIYPHPAPPSVIAVARAQELRPAFVEPVAPAPVVAPEPAPERITNNPAPDEKATANPAARAIRSVGRVLGIGRKDKDEK